MAELASARIPAALTVTAAVEGVPATAVRLPPASRVSELSWTEPPIDWRALVEERPTFWAFVASVRLAVLDSNSVVWLSGRSRPVVRSCVRKPLPRPVEEVSAMMSGRIESEVRPRAPLAWPPMLG